MCTAKEVRGVLLYKTQEHWRYNFEIWDCAQSKQTTGTMPNYITHMRWSLMTLCWSHLILIKSPWCCSDKEQFHLPSDSNLKTFHNTIIRTSLAVQRLNSNLEAFQSKNLFSLNLSCYIINFGHTISWTFLLVCFTFSSNLSAVTEEIQSQS
jgi:hypothetical protein